MDWDLREFSLPLPPPWQRVGSNDSWLLERLGPNVRPGHIIQPGLYQIRLSFKGQIFEKKLLVKEDDLQFYSGR